jgi:hypothetical protein
MPVNYVDETMMSFSSLMSSFHSNFSYTLNSDVSINYKKLQIPPSLVSVL